MGNENNKAGASAATSSKPAMTIRRGNTTYLVGVHFNPSGKATVEDRIRSMMLNDLKKNDV